MAKVSLALIVTLSALLLSGCKMPACGGGTPLPGWSYNNVTNLPADNYWSARGWVEHCCNTSTVPSAERLFVVRTQYPPYAGIVPHRTGITVSDVIAATPCDRTRGVEVYRGHAPNSSRVLRENEIDPDYAIAPLDVIVLHEQTSVLKR